MKSRIESCPGTIWLIGPACAGKTVLARLLVWRLRENGAQALLLDGDEIRSIYENQLGYDPASRRKQTARVVRLARWTQRQDVVPVVAIIHPFEDDRVRCRREMPGYFEVYLRCSLEERIRRDAKKLYLPAIKGEKRHVVDVDIPFDVPKNPDLVLDSGRLPPEALLEQLWTRLMTAPDEA